VPNWRWPFDATGDRLGVVTKDGEIIYPDRQLMLFAARRADAQSRAQIIYDVKCTAQPRAGHPFQGGVPLMWQTGHAIIKAKLKETGAALAGEMSGPHVLQGALVRLRRRPVCRRAPARNRLALGRRQLAVEAPARCTVDAGAQHQDAGRRAATLIARLKADAVRLFPGAVELIGIDGVRAEYADGFGLARASNTTPVVVLRFEADSAAALARIQNEFRRALQVACRGWRSTSERSRRQRMREIQG